MNRKTKNQQNAPEITEIINFGYPEKKYKSISEDKIKELGKKEAVKEISESQERHIRKFKSLSRRVNIPLLKIRTYKPFDFFPTEIIIDRLKVNISTRNYFFMRKIQSIEMREIHQVFVETTPWYATLRIISKGRNLNDVKILFLKKEDAKKARRLIEGLLVALTEGVDLSSVPDEEIMKEVEKIGEAEKIEHASKMQKDIIALGFK